MLPVGSRRPSPYLMQKQHQTKGTTLFNNFGFKVASVKVIYKASESWLSWMTLSHTAQLISGSAQVRKLKLQAVYEYQAKSIF